MIDNPVHSAIAAMVHRHRPTCVLQTGGWNGELMQIVASILAKQGDGTLTVLEADNYRHAALQAIKTALGHANTQIRRLDGQDLVTHDRYDFVIFNGAYSDPPGQNREAEFFHILPFLKQGSTIVFVGFKQDIAFLDNLPRKLEAMNVLCDLVADSLTELYIGTYATVADAAEKRMVFCASAGRSGTAFLTSLLSGASGLVALHEPKPWYNAETLALQADPSHARRFVEQIKWPWIRSLPGHSYVELSHYVLKGFLEAWLDIGVRPDLIVLRRDPRKIALSRFAMGIDFFDRPQTPKQHMLHPDDRRPLHLRLPAWERFNNYQLCYWYALETETRITHYADLLSERFAARIFCTSLENLAVDIDEVSRLYAWLNVPVHASDISVLAARQSRRINDMRNNKFSERLRASADLDLDSLEHEVNLAVASDDQPLLALRNCLNNGVGCA